MKFISVKCKRQIPKLANQLVSNQDTVAEVKLGTANCIGERICSCLQLSQADCVEEDAIELGGDRYL